MPIFGTRLATIANPVAPPEWTPDSARFDRSATSPTRYVSNLEDNPVVTDGGQPRS